VLDQSRIQTGERARVAEQGVGGPFGLVRRPIILNREAAEHFLVRRVQLVRDGVQQIRPGGLDLAVHQPLRLVGILKPGEAVFTPDVAEAGLVHASGQPLAAIQADLDPERGPGLDAGMHEAEQRVDLVVIEEQALARGGFKEQPLFVPAAPDLERPARFDSLPLRRRGR
jgi:hypothetical protein